MFEVGEFVVCVDDQPREGGAYISGTGRPLTKGLVYTVAGLHENPYADWIGIALEEVPPPSPFPFWAFHPDRFRPVSSKSSELFTSLLNPVQTKELEPN